MRGFDNVPVQLCLLLWAAVWSSNGHLCLLTPRQRGDLDISEGGSHTCFRHGAECGGEPAQVPPNVVLEGGKPVFIKWQQNYNHYSYGFPGLSEVDRHRALRLLQVDLSISEVSLRMNVNRTTIFRLRQRLHETDTTLPNKDCDHCVIRARYVAHKPGETTFYQCADIKIKATKAIGLKHSHGKLQLFGQEQTNMHKIGSLGERRLRRALALVRSSHAKQVTKSTTRGDVFESSSALYGMANDLDNPLSAAYFSINPESGEKTQIGKVDFRVDSSFDPARLPNGSVSHKSTAFVPDGVFSVDPTRGITAMPINSFGKRESFPESMVEIQTATGKTFGHYRIEKYNKTIFTSAFSAVLVEREKSFVTFSIEPSSTQKGKYDFVVGRLLTTGMWQMLMKFNQSEDLYVNFQWAEYDVDSQTLYALLGNENDADHLSARLYKFVLPQGFYGAKSSFVELDVSEFTFMSFHVNKQNSNHVWAISPGLHDARYPAYHLVDINTDIGSVQHVAQLTPPGIFERYYGGAVAAGGPGDTNHLLRHVLRVADTQADVILTVDTLQGKASFSQVTNLRGLHNLVYV
ncbi:hypothetical protein ElyMa_004590600 [Elysia marginata]|uniref:Laminin G domain-containing protein n=1 Tax=Elysia marginata TaxID=1093978 RepID=A0AAV4HYG7_9GAST|nr:hypothetical protein ElyMa_004590600 [Elysia marginata]